MKKSSKKFKITLLRGFMGKTVSQRRTLEALGFRRRLQTIEVDDGPAIRGQILKVQHLLKVEVVK